MMKEAKKSRTLLSLIILLILLAGLTAASQETSPQNEPEEPAPESLYVRLTFYPTASLSRYDYNNDVDLYEVRAYAEVRQKSATGVVVRDARVTVMSQPLDFLEDHYEKKLAVDKDNLPGEVDVVISAAERPAIKRKFPIPFWLILLEPRPTIVEPGSDLPIKWGFSAFSSPVDLRVYDFKKGDAVFDLNNAGVSEVTVPAERIPASTTLRIYVISSWLFKRFLSGEEFASGSEVNIIPWSQVFIRVNNRTEE